MLSPLVRTASGLLIMAETEMSMPQKQRTWRMQRQKRMTSHSKREIMVIVPPRLFGSSVQLSSLLFNIFLLN